MTSEFAGVIHCCTYKEKFDVIGLYRRRLISGALLMT